MNKNLIAVMLSLVIAVGSVGAVPAIAAEEGETTEMPAETKEMLPEQEQEEAGLESGQSAEETEQADNSEEMTDESVPEEITSGGPEVSGAEEEDIEEPSILMEDTDEPAAQEEITEELDTEAYSVAAMDSGSADIVDSGTCGDSLTWTLDQGGTLTISGTGEMRGAPWRDTHQSEVKKAVLEYGVTSIGEYGFDDCRNLTSITIPDTVTKIDFCAFMCCISLKNITIPKGVMSIGSTAFYDCTSLESITIPEGVTSIEDQVFSGCENLTSVTIPDSVTSIGERAFSGCVSLTNITIPKNVTSIGKWGFLGCSALTSITIPDGVTSIGYDAFGSCSSLTSVTIPEGVTSIGDSAFNNCDSLTSITIPEGVTSIGIKAFYDCNSLTSITIPDSVTSIGNEALKYCPKLTVAVYSGSYAEEYVKSERLPYKVICKKHAWNKDYTVDKEPTYTEEGSKSIHCSVCDAVKEGSSVSIPKLVNPLGKTARGDMFNLANNVKVTWKEVPGAKFYKVYREGITNSAESRKEPVIVTTGLVGWDKDPGLTNGHAYRYKIVASTTGKGDSSGDSPLSYSKLMYRLKTVVIRSVKNTAPGKVTVKYDRTDSGDSYVLQYCEREDMVGAKTKVVLGASNTSYVIGGLKKGKTYYISIRVRKKVNGIDYYTTFGVPKKVTITK